MSGITPLSVATYTYTVDNLFSRYVNVSFPFRVRIDSVWFTGDSNLLNGTSETGQVFDSSFRVLKLAGIKSANPRVVLSDYDPPSDWNQFFGVVDDIDDNSADEALKPTMWLGLPDDATAEVLKDSTTQYAGTPFFGAGFRSSTGSAPALASGNNGFWYNDGWNEPQYNANRYKTDLGVMNPDEILSLFVYNDSGDWTDYDGTGTATIHVAYTGIGSGIFPAAGKTPWSDWWYD